MPGNMKGKASKKEFKKRSGLLLTHMKKVSLCNGHEYITIFYFHTYVRERIDMFLDLTKTLKLAFFFSFFFDAVQGRFFKLCSIVTFLGSTNS